MLVVFGSMLMTTTSEIVVKGTNSKSQVIANTVMQWSFENRVKLN